VHARHTETDGKKIDSTSSVKLSQETLTMTRSNWKFVLPKTLEAKVIRFFEILDTTEISDNSGKSWHPVQISSCRVMRTAELSKLLPAMKRQARRRADGKNKPIQQVS
jgi:hypothetical protein